VGEGFPARRAKRSSSTAVAQSCARGELREGESRCAADVVFLDLVAQSVANEFLTREAEGLVEG
jgi:hypothetical protein